MEILPYIILGLLIFILGQVGRAIPKKHPIHNILGPIILILLIVFLYFAYRLLVI